MTRVQRKVHRLTMRDESADVLAQAIKGHRQSIPINNSNLTRYIRRDRANPLEMVEAMIRCLPAERGALVLAYLEDAYEDQHGGHSEADLREMFAALDEKDNAEDRVRFLAAHSHYTEAELRQWLREAREYDHLADQVRRLVGRTLAEMRKPLTPSKPAVAWRSAEARAAS